MRILTEPNNALVKQYIEMMSTESVKVIFTDDAISEIAEVAAVVNERTENIGARRLYTVWKSSSTEIAFDAPDLSGKKITIDANYVRERLSDIIEDEDLTRYIL